MLIKSFYLAAFLGLSLITGSAQEKSTSDKPAQDKPAAEKAADENVRTVLWESVDIPQRDVYWGAGGKAMFPQIETATYVAPHAGGNNHKHRIKDANGVEWIVKIADEAQPEVAATRLLWALGYKTEIDYIVPQFSMTKVGPARYNNVRIEARPDKVKRLDRWSWTSNPFVDTREFNGLKILMAMINNWDLKDENTVILSNGVDHYYVVSDLGSSFGKLAKQSDVRSGRTVNKPEHYAQSNFVKAVADGKLEFDYVAKADHLIKGIPVEHGRWLADLLLQLSDKQIGDAFRAANYSRKDAELLTAAFKARIEQLNAATRAPAATAAR
jgi:hypothetical protein